MTFTPSNCDACVVDRAWGFANASLRSHKSEGKSSR